MSLSTMSPTTYAAAWRTALVSGASFAGLTAAVLLQRLGYDVTIVERASGLRHGGTAIDIEGEAVGVLDRAGLLDALRAKALPPRFYDIKGPDNATLAVRGPGDGDEDEVEYEMHRDDMRHLLADALSGKAELLFSRSITALEEGPDGVSVTFTDGTRRNFGLVIGCDGYRSNTRKLVFGPDEQFSQFLGAYAFLKVVPETGLVPPGRTEMFSTTGRLIMLKGYEDRTDLVFGFRSDREIEYDYRDKAQQRRLVKERLEGLGWKVPAMLPLIDGDGDFYFDRVTQIRMTSWSRGRVVLIGDAAYCVSPLAGFGSSMAIIGAGRLADALAAHPDDHETSFRAYEEGLRPFVKAIQEHAAIQRLQMLIPADEAELAARDHKLATGTFWA